MTPKDSKHSQPPDARKWLLKFTTGINIGAEVPLGSNRSYVIGTAKDCDIILHDKGLTAHHAKIITTENEVMVEPLEGVVAMENVQIRKKTIVPPFVVVAFQYTSCMLGPADQDWPDLVSPGLIKEKPPSVSDYKFLNLLSREIKRKTSSIAGILVILLILITGGEFAFRLFTDHQKQLEARQMQTIEDIFIHDYENLNLSLLQNGFKELFIVSSHAEKKYYLTGYVRDKKRMTEALDILNMGSDFETVNQALVVEDILMVMSETLAFLGYNTVQAEYDGGGRFALSGFVPKYEDIMVARQNIFQDIMGIKSLTVRVFSQRIEEVTAGVNFGSRPYIADAEGNRYFEGAYIEPRVRLEKITRDELLFDYSGRILAYRIKHLQKKNQ